MMRKGLAAALVMATLAWGWGNAARAQVATIHNDFYTLDTGGARINTRSGCLRQFNGLFYWYGGTNRFQDQTCYTSSDLMHWTYKGVVLHCEVDANRIDVLYNEPTKTYVMFLKYDGNGAHFAIATAASPEGPFTLKSKTLVDGALMGDMSMYQDSDGKAYLCYVSWATGTNAQHGIYRMSPDYLTLEKRLFLWDIHGREAPHMFKRNGIYYYGTSKTAWIDSSGTSYYTAKDLAGPWSEARPLVTPGSNNSWDSQVDFVYPFEGKQGTVYLFAGDRWLKNGGRQGEYVWLPLEWEGDVPTLKYYQDWDLDVAAGTWTKFDDARDVARGKAVTASSETADHPAASVTRATTYADYAANRWESAASDPQWISVDLGAAQEIDRVMLKWHADFAKAFAIQTSVDGETWKEVYTTKEGAGYAVTDVTFGKTQARYVRMIGTERGVARLGRTVGVLRGAAATRAAAATTMAASTQNSGPHGYSLFRFAVLDD